MVAYFTMTKVTKTMSQRSGDRREKGLFGHTVTILDKRQENQFYWKNFHHSIWSTTWWNIYIYRFKNYVNGMQELTEKHLLRHTISTLHAKDRRKEFYQFIFYGRKQLNYHLKDNKIECFYSKRQAKRSIWYGTPYVIISK